MNRVLGSVHYESDLPDAIEQIRAFRKKHGGVYNAATLPELGSEPLSEDPRHITPWLNRASLGGLLFSSEADSGGFRSLSEQGVPRQHL